MLQQYTYTCSIKNKHTVHKNRCRQNHILLCGF